MRPRSFCCAIALLAPIAVANAQPAKPAFLIRLQPANEAPEIGPPPPKTPLLRERDKLAFRAIAKAEAEKAHVPFDLVDAVMKIESDYNPTRLGGLDEIGLMQVRPGTAAMLGFKDEEGSLAAPAINIHYGTTYLGEAWRLAGGNVCRALMKYRAGHGEEAMSALSVNYCAKAKAHLVAIGSPLASGIGDVDLIPVVAAPAPSIREPSIREPTIREPTIREPSGRPKTGAKFWTAFEARIKRANARIESKWRRTASR